MDERTLFAPVREVTLFEDRARVVRRGALTLPPGQSRVQIAGVAPVLSDKTVIARCATTSVRIVDTRVRRQAVRQCDDEMRENWTAREQLTSESEALATRLLDRQAERDDLARQADMLAQLCAETLADLSHDAAWGSAPGDEWPARIDQLHQRESALRGQLVRADAELQRLRGEAERLNARLQRTESPEQTEVACIEIVLLTSTATEAELQLEYIVPNACWRPYHTAEQTAEGLCFQTDACVWQRTGEDWQAVQLHLSTERASLGSDPPELHSDILRRKRRSATTSVGFREQQIETSGLGSAGRQPVELPGIDDSGETVQFTADSLASVPSDGQPYRFRLGRFSTDLSRDLVAYPELTPCVIERTTQTNTGQFPILAGPVDLIRNRGLIGRTAVLYIAQDERFELCWGPDAALRLKRHVDVQQDKSRLLSSWIKRAHRIEVRLSNLSAEARELRVTERVPISEIDKVNIEFNAEQTTEQRQPDANGFVNWSLSLPPFGHRTLELQYVLERHEDVTGL